MQLIAAALTLFDDDRPILDLNARYAHALAALRPDGVLLFGITGQGGRLRTSERQALLEIYARVFVPEQLIVGGAAHDPAEAKAVTDAGMRFLAPPWPSNGWEELAAFLDAAPQALLYSHPIRTPLVVTVELLQRLDAAGARPAGVKLSKASTEDVTAIRRAHPTVPIYHGTDRDLFASEQAGAAGVISYAFGALADLPGEGQAAADDVRQQVEAAAQDKLNLLAKLAVSRLQARGW